MGSKGDINGLIRGLGLIRKAMMETQGKDMQHMWKNSSIKTAAEGIGSKLQEGATNDPAKATEILKKSQEAFSLMYSQAATAYSGFQNNQSNTGSGDSSMNQEFFSNDMSGVVEKDFDIPSPFNDSNIADLDSPIATTFKNDMQENVSAVNNKTMASTSVDQITNFSAVTSTLDTSPIDVSIDPAVMTGVAEGIAKKAAEEKKQPPPAKKKAAMSAEERKRRKQLLNEFKPELSDKAQERKVPSSRPGRMMTFGGLFVGLGAGAVSEMAKRTLGLNKITASDVSSAVVNKNPLLSEANMNRIVDTLCRARGAALKLGQMLSLQDESLVSPEIQTVLERVRQSADFMPAGQMEGVMAQEFGSQWREKLDSFEGRPFAAASIGQVHRAVLHDGRTAALKIQYPGVAKSIENDINNLMGVLSVWNVIPKGLYVDSVIEVAKMELAWEVDYIREARCSKIFKELLKDDPAYYIPEVIDELTTGQVLTTEYVQGLPLDKCFELDQETKNMIGEKILGLCLRELFEFKFMQTDPNWSNFFYNPETDKVVLLDFGATRAFSKEFVDGYIEIIKSAADGDRQGVLENSRKLGFLTGYETKDMEQAHVDAVMILGEGFHATGGFDFGKQDTTRRIHNLIPVMMKHRLTPPPEETYSLHRKMAGAFLLCAKLDATVDCRSLFDPIYAQYKTNTEGITLENYKLKEERETEL